MSLPRRETVEQLRREYPEGSRVELLRMDDPQAPAVGTLGTVQGVDDIGSIMVAWDNGSHLSVAYGKDHCRVITPEAPPGSTLTLIKEDGEWKLIGPIPQIDTSQIPQYAIEALARTTLECVREWFKDPEIVKKFEEWKAKRKAEGTPGEKAP